MNEQTVHGALLVAVPAIAGLVGLLLPQRSRRAAASLGIAAAAIAFLVTIFYFLHREPSSQEVGVLARFGDLAVTFGVRADETAAAVAIAVAAVALAVQVYSTAYLRSDDRYGPYAAQVSLFTAAMMLVVVSSDLVTLLVGWEVMGLCSYLLIGHDRSLPEAPGAAVKAFLVTRVGDVGFLLGIVILGLDAGSFRIADVLAQGQAPTVACVLLLAGVAGKSAQFPLHTWLPDAMAGPTPISALIHAATMVAAGVYVVATLFTVFTHTALTVLAVMAAITMLLGALVACAQDDVKRVLAWSTVSQLGYMTGALAVGGVPQSLFHLLTHAAFKALLFLCAGALIHAVGTNLMSGMGGLRRSMPITFVTMTIGLAALAGVPPLSGFWSKESILGAAEHAAAEGSAAGWLVLVSGGLTVVVTGAYVTRLWLRTFFGAPRAAHDPPAAMRWPLLVLAVPAALLGFLALRDGLLPVPNHGWFAYQPGDVPPVQIGGELRPEPVAAAVAVALAALGALAAYLVWRRNPSVDPFVRPVLVNAFYLDAVQDAVVVRPVRALARVVKRADESLVDGAVEGTATSAVGVGGLLARAHAAGLGRYATAVLAGGLLLAAAAVVTGEVIS